MDVIIEIDTDKIEDITKGVTAIYKIAMAGFELKKIEFNEGYTTIYIIMGIKGVKA